jgi:Fe-S-cluster-containing hydrogenase component 2
MSVIIDDTCITCDACLQNCPVNAIVDDMSNPTGESRYYVHPEKCVECVGIYDDPQCAAICPSIGCITWDKPYTVENEAYFLENDLYAISSTKSGKVKSPSLREKKYREDITDDMRAAGVKVQEEPEELEAG